MYSAARMAYLLIIKLTQAPKTAGIQLLLLPAGSDGVDTRETRTESDFAPLALVLAKAKY
jgi:hypothetical protein